MAEKTNFLTAPFPYFGGKARVAPLVWDALGDPEHYLEPFCGSSACLLSRSNGLELLPSYNETINDIDGHIANIWRSLKYNPEETASYADDIVCHVDLTAKKKYIHDNYDSLLDLLKSDPEAHNPRMAGYYIWAASAWIGKGLTSPKQRPHLTTGGMGVHKGSNANIYAWFETLQRRLRRVRIVNGDYKQILGGDWQDLNWANVGIFFDPPYSAEAGRDNKIYGHEDLSIAHEVREYCIERGKRKNYRIVLAGYYNEHVELLGHGWRVQRWKACGGYGNTTQDKDSMSKGQKNCFKEALFFSPHCVGGVNNQLFQ